MYGETKMGFVILNIKRRNAVVHFFSIYPYIVKVKLENERIMKVKPFVSCFADADTFVNEVRRKIQKNLAKESIQSSLIDSLVGQTFDLKKEA